MTKGKASGDSATERKVATVGVVVFARPYRTAILALLECAPSLIPADLGAVSDDIGPKLRHLRPDAIVLDLPATQMLPFVRSIRKQLPDLVIIAANCGDTEHDLLPLFEAGISGFVPTEASDTDVLQTIRTALDGEVNCPPRIVAALIRRVQKPDPPSDARRRTPTPHLTPRQAQIVRLIDQGLSNKEIALRLGIGVSTVKNHVHGILCRLAVHRRGEAVLKLGAGPPLRVVRGKARRRGATEGEP